MLRRLFSTDKWSSLTLLQLRDELAKRGLKRGGTKQELVKRLAESEIVRPPPAELQLPEEQEEQLETKNLESLNKSYILEEILKRRPGMQVSQRLNKKKLIELLNSIIIDERGLEINVKDLRSLVLRLHRNYESLSSESICSVLDNLSDLYHISQLDMNVLLNTDSDLLAPVWELVFKRLDELSPQNLYVVLKSLPILQNFFMKNFSAGSRIDVESLEHLLSQVSKHISHYSPYEIAKVIEMSNKLTTSVKIQNIQNELKHKVADSLEDLSIYTENQLLTLLDAFPPGSYYTHKEIIDRIVKKVYYKPRSSKFERPLQTLYTLKNLGAPFPVNLVLELNFLPRDFLRRLAPLSLVQTAKILCEQEKLSVDMARNIMEILAAHNFVDSTGLALYANYIYLLHEHSIFAMVLQRVSLLNRCIVNEENLDLVSALKISLCYLPHMSNDSLASRLIQELMALDSTDNRWKELTHFLLKIMSDLVETTKEKPIFNYQFQSYSQLVSNTKQQLGVAIARILENFESTSSELFEFYSSNLCENAPEKSVFEQNIPVESIASFAKALWKFKYLYTKEQLISIVQRAFKTLSKENPKDSQAAYLLSQVNLIDEQITSDAYISLESIKQQALNFVENYDIYSLPILYNFNKTPNDSLLQELESRIQLGRCFDGVLVKNLIMLGRASSFSQFPKASENLGFRNRAEPPLQTKVVTDLIETLCACGSENLDLEGISDYLSHYIDQIDQTHCLMLTSLLRPRWQSINLELKKHLESVELNSSPDIERINEFTEGSVVREKLVQVAQSIRPSFKNIHLIDSFKNQKIALPGLLNAYLTLLPRLKEENELIELVDKLLETSSVTGQAETIINNVQEYLDRYNLWQILPFRSIVNYLFLHSESPQTIKSAPAHIVDLFQKGINKGASSDEEFVHPKSGLKCYTAFTYKTKLEPRSVTSNDIDLKSRYIVYSPEPVMPQQEIFFYKKIHSILNALKMEHLEEAHSAVNEYYKQRAQDPELQEFRYSFLKVLGYAKRHRVMEVKSNENRSDPITQWKPDLLFDASKLAIFAHTEKEALYSANGQEAGVTFINKVIKEQIEKISGFRVLGLRTKLWNEMEETKRVQLVNHLQNKFKLDSF